MMKLFSLLKSASRKSSVAKKSGINRQIFLEHLETRLVLSTYTVTNTSNLATTAGSLGYQIAAAVAANDNAASIVFSGIANNATIQLTAGDALSSAAKYGPSGYFINGTSGTGITIDGAGAPGLSISGGSAIRPFVVAAGNSLTVRNLVIKNGLANGTTSGNGGGGAGMGGAILVDGGLFSASNVTFQANTVHGGNSNSSASATNNGGGTGGTPVPASGAFGGGGEGKAVLPGGNGGFGGGGGTCGSLFAGGDGGFGGGGGSGPTAAKGGIAGFGAGNGAKNQGGGGAGLGGAIFNNNGQLILAQVTFNNNSATGGTGASAGGGYGGAVFSRNGQVNDAGSNSFSGNTAASGGTNIYIMADTSNGGNNTSPGNGLVATNVVQSSPGIMVNANGGSIIGLPSKIVLTSPATGKAGTAFSAVVATIQDSSGNNEVGLNMGTVTISLSGGSFSTGSTLTANIVNGVATFTNLVPISAGNLVLTASSGSLASGTCNAWVNPSPASQMIVSAPASAVKGLAVTVTVSVQDHWGNVVTDYPYALKLSSSIPFASAVPDVTPVNGVATFSNVVFSQTGSTNLSASVPPITVASLAATNRGSFAMDSSGNIYTSVNNDVVKIKPDGTVVTLASGFNRPQGVAVDSAGNVYVADMYNNAVKEIKTDGSIVTLGQVGVNGFNGFWDPRNVALDSSGNIYVSDYWKIIYKIDKNTGVVSFSQQFSDHISYMAVDAAGDVYFSQGTSGNEVYHLNGTGGDLVYQFSSLLHGIAFQPWTTNSQGNTVQDGTLYVSDFANWFQMKSLDVINKSVFHTDVLPTSFAFDDFIVDSLGNYYFRNYWDNSIVKLPHPLTDVGTSVTVNSLPVVTSQPINAGVESGQTATFTVAATGVPAPTVQWQVHTLSSWSDISGATNYTLPVLAGVGDDGKQYRAVLTNAAGTVTSNAATLRIGVAPKFTSTNEMTIPVGLTSGISVIATGSPAPTYSITAGTLPSGVTLNSTTGLFSGTPAAGTAGNWPVTIQASNGINTPATQAFSLKVTGSVTSFVISKGQTQRSYIRYLDLGLDSNAAALTLLNNPGRVQLTKANLDGNGSTNVPLTGFLSVPTGQSKLALDFGTVGLGNSRNTTTANGYYTLGLDLDGNGTFETMLYFFRLFGDINGDRQVDAADQTTVLAGCTVAYNVNLDLNGDGVVNTSDFQYVKKSVGRKLKSTLIVTS